MRDGFVAYASVGVSWCTLSQATEATGRLLDQIASGSRFVVPGLWMFEVANTLLVLTRRKLLAPEECARGRCEIDDLTPVIDEDGHRLALGRIYDLAAEHALSVYDAVYLELALRRKLPLASRDTALNKAAKRCGLKLLL